MKLLRRIIILSSSLAAFAEADSTHFQKVHNAVGLLRDLITREGHVADDRSSTLHPSGLSLISGGFPRTGTKSIEAVLAQLGFTVYDSRAMVKHDHFDAWIHAAKEWKERDDLEPMKSLVQEMESLGYTATLDIPMNLLAPALIQVRPEAKVLWNYRAKGVEDWYRSMGFINWMAEPLMYARPWKWILPNPSRRMRPLVQMLTSVNQPDLAYPEHLERPLPWFERLTDDMHPLQTSESIKQSWIEAYESFPKHLQSALVEARGVKALDTQYLDYTVQEGWEPLIKFILGEDSDYREMTTLVLQSQFPHVNDRSTLIMIRKVMDFVGMVLPMLVLLLLHTVAVLVRRTVYFVTKKTGIIQSKYAVPPKRAKIE